MKYPGGTALTPVVGRRAPSGSGSHGTLSRLPIVYPFLGAILVAYSISLIVRANGETWTWLDGWGTASFELVASLLVLLRAQRVERDRAIAITLGVGMSCWALGDFAMTIETLGGATAPVLGAAQILWACFYPFAYVGLMLLIRRDVRKLSLANWLDGLVAGLGAAAVFAAFLFGGIAKAAGGGALSVATNLVFPVGDVLLLILAMAGIAMLPSGHRTRWYLLGAAILINAIGDGFALFPSGIGASHVGFFFNSAAWPASLFLMSAAMWLRSAERPATTFGDRPASFIVPGVAAGASLVILLVGSLRHMGGVAIALATVTLIVAGARVGLSLIRLRLLTEERHNQLADAAQAERASREALQEAVRTYSEFAAKVADGDLTVAVGPNGGRELHSLSESLNLMVAGLADISTELHGGVRDMRSATAEILAAVSQYSASATEQSEAIDETATTVEEVRMAVEQTARKAGDVAEQAKQAVRVGDDGMHAVEAIAAAMEEIRERVDGMASDVRTLSERTQRIGEITATVNDIADRSNLLALNASVEAARAGEHGAGFAVVATEVRDLADQSRAATAEVERVLRDIQTAMSAAVAATRQGTTVVDRGLELTKQAGCGIQTLTETIRAAASAAQEIAASASEQSLGVGQIAAAMRNVSEITTSGFVAGAESTQRAAEDLNDLSAKLAALTERYHVDASVGSRALVAR